MDRTVLEKRTFEFSKNIILASKNIPKNEANRIMINQLLRAATSIGANYREANGAPTRKDFKNKIHICKKESQESYYWISLIIDTNEASSPELVKLQDESNQLLRIFGKITSTLSKVPL
jgi:four helix bundle protein